MKNEETVVVPAVEYPSSLACLRSLGKRGVRTAVVADDEYPEVACSRYCDEFVRVPAPDERYGEYEDFLLALARRDDVRTIIPLRDEDVYVLAANREEFAEHVATPWPTLETLRNVQDRVRLFEAAERAGVPTPETKLLGDTDDWSRRLIVKPRFSVLGDAYLEDAPADAVVRPRSTEYLPPGEEPDADALRVEFGHEPIVQEYVPTTDEYGFFALYDRGEAVATFQHRQIRGILYSGGASAFRESVSIPELEAEGRKLLDSLDWHGLAMVEFLRDPATDEFRLMEVNPRFWSSLPFSVEAGADFPYYYWLLATGASDRIDCQYDVGVAGHLLWGEVKHLVSVLEEDYELVDRPAFSTRAYEILRSLARHPRFDYFDLRDPHPFVRNLRTGVESLAAAAIEAGSTPRG